MSIVYLSAFAVALSAILSTVLSSGGDFGSCPPLSVTPASSKLLTKFLTLVSELNASAKLSLLKCSEPTFCNKVFNSSQPMLVAPCSNLRCSICAKLSKDSASVSPFFLSLLRANLTFCLNLNFLVFPDLLLLRRQLLRLKLQIRRLLGHLLLCHPCPCR